MSNPEVTRVVLARHGQTDYNHEGRLQGQIDIPLNRTGRAQAEELARALAAEDFDVIVSSPLSRAHETAKTIAGYHDAEVRTDGAFLERAFGQWEGLTGEEMHERFPDRWAEWVSQKAIPDLGVESRAAVGQRFGEAARRLVDRNPGATVLVVAHGAAIRAGVTHLLGLDVESFPGIAGLGNCHYSELETLRSDPTGRTMRLLSHNVPPGLIRRPER
jgi:probable phosphoglycerate mutase